MAATTSSLLEDLTGAMALSSAALEDGADFKLQRAAMRSLHRALNRTAESDELWTGLTARAAGISHVPALPPDLGSVDALLDSVADVFVERYAVLLVAGGYKSPPPPRLNELLSTTRRALVHSAESQPLDRVANARDGLRNFVEEFAKNVKSHNRWLQMRSLQGGRGVAAASLLLPLIVSTEFKTGDEFDISFGFSWKDKSAIEITVPRPWELATEAAAERIAWGGVELLERETDSAHAALRPRPGSARDALDQRFSEMERAQDEAAQQEAHQSWANENAAREQERDHGRGM